MRIAFVSYDFGEYCIQHANGLLQNGEVMLILPQQLAEPHLSLLNPQVEFRPFDKPRLRQPLRQLRCMRRIVRQIRDFDPDVVHFQSGHLWFNMALPLLKRYALVFTIHDPRRHLGDRGARKTPQWVMDFGYRQADRVIVHGTQLKDVVASEVLIQPEKIHVIPLVAIGQRPRAAPASSEEDLILFFGRIWEYKGLDYLIRAQPLINREVPSAKIMIAGRGEDLDRYRLMMEDPDRFIVHDRWISDDERAEMFQRASVVVLPYVEATQSAVVPVAYTYRKPVVATRVGGLPDIVEHGRTGLLVPPRDSDALATAIITLLKDARLRREMGARGARKLEAECAPDVVAAQTMAVYRLAVQDRRPTQGKHQVTPLRRNADGRESQQPTDAAR
ncbi:MAG: glycosyltransferase family 4 protein [Candidatus Tectomicrobia bacterium]|nr:glycosyltransferase family 4 protein [Candidatus Tectomicrobia bacterium]